MKTISQKVLMLLSFTAFLIFSCKKQNTDNNNQGHLKQTKTFSAEVALKWMNMQLDMLRVPLVTGTGTQAADRAMAYCGIALYESVLPGMPSSKTFTGQLTDFPVMPGTESGKAYHWAACANAALAEMNRKLFPTTSAPNKSRMDSLENALQAGYSTEADSVILLRSILFGKEVASRIFLWAANDGSANINPSFVPAIGPGLWASTPPNFPVAVNPYAFQRRPLVQGVINGITLDAPPAYSTDPASPFYAMVKDVYDKSQELTSAQIAIAIYNRDAPGYPGGGHFVAILWQLLSKAESMLDVAAIAYAKAGIAVTEASTNCFIHKYNFNLVRPITYIRNVLGYTTWNAQFNTPGHPEFPSAHAVNAAAFATVLTSVFGPNFQFTLHSYDYLGLPSRSYNSIEEMVKEMADSRVFAGIHYQASVDKGRGFGEKIAKNILDKIKF